MRDVVPNPGNFMNEGLDPLEHAVHDRGEFVERVVHFARRQPLPQITGDDALGPLIDFLDPILGPNAK